MLADQLVELNVVETISHECVRQVLKKPIKPWQKRMWCILAQSNAHFVCQMESVLEVYKRPQDPLYPVICMDETSVQCIILSAHNILAPSTRTISRIAALKNLAVERLGRQFFALLSKKY